MESILEYHIRNIKERTGIEFTVEEGSTWENPSLRYHAAKELFRASEDKTGIATVEDCFIGMQLQKDTLDNKIKKIPQNAIQSTAIAKLTKGDLDFDLTTWLDDLHKAKEENTSAFNMANDTGYLMAIHGRLTILMNEMTDMNVAGYVNHYRQVLKNNIKMDRERLNMTDNEWRHQSWLSTLYGVARQYVHLLGKGKQ
nr:MAG TPA: hypothetical protein [Caudoviricetes sp.]